MIFNSSNGVCDSPLFKPLINKCYSNIKPKLLEELNNELAIKQKKYEIRYNRNYTNEFYQRKGRL